VTEPPSRWADAAAAAALLALDPAALGGAVLRAAAGPVRDRWLALFRQALPPDAPIRRIPLSVGDERLLGGIDLAATLRAGRPVAERGILAEADGGVVVLAMAERLSAAGAARFTGMLDRGTVMLERDGLAATSPARVGVIALDEGIAEDERPPPALLDRLALHLDLTGLGLRDTREPPGAAGEIVAARARLAGVTAGEDAMAALCATALALGIDSLRAPLLALRVARAAAALAGREAVVEADVALAARLVLAPRATVLPSAVPPPPSPEAPQEPETGDGSETAEAETRDAPLEDVVLDAAEAAIPAGLLALLKSGAAPRARTPGRSGELVKSGARGRPAGVRRGEPRGGNRLNLMETLRAAAPWQRLRERAGARIAVRPEDFRVTRFRPRMQTTTVFVVDASGSAALHRLAEAKGAVELLLADCYVRRDRVAVLAFRGAGAELLLPPTRSLVRAKKGLAGLPGGGGTPLAAAIDAAVLLADGVRRRGETPSIVLLTDGRANIARDGTPGRQRAEADALLAARQARAAGFASLLVDTSPRPRPEGRTLADAMGALYLPLPYADAGAVSRAVQATDLRARQQSASRPA